MMMSFRRLFLMALPLAGFLLPASGANANAAMIHDNPIVLAAAQTCKQVASCEEAVELWCSGYRRADADKDGIPCENICHSLEQVEKIRNAIGC